MANAIKILITPDNLYVLHADRLEIFSYKR